VFRFDLAWGSSPDRENLDEKFRTMCRIYNEIAEYAAVKGVSVDIHPHSHAGSIIETAGEYEKLMDMTDQKLVGWCPDTGHILRGGLDLMETLSAYSPRIRHVHFKDVDSRGTWKRMGAGVCDFKAVLELLERIGYSGWVICEEESQEAYSDQKGAVFRNREYLKSLGYY
jgi:inosose dehydratase